MSEVNKELQDAIACVEAKDPDHKLTRQQRMLEYYRTFSREDLIETINGLSECYAKLPKLILSRVSPRIADLESDNAELRRDLVSAKATIATLSNSDTVRALTQSMEDVKAGRVTRFTDDLDDAIAKEK